MDPWLELRLRDVHASIIVYIRNQLQRQLPDSLIARAEEDILLDAADQPPRLVRPDAPVSEERTDMETGGVAVLPPPRLRPNHSWSGWPNRR